MGEIFAAIFSPITCVLWLIVGSIAGSLAHQLVGQGRAVSWMPDIVLGLVGAFIGGIILSYFNIGFRGAGLNTIWNPMLCCGHLLVATFGASVLILLGRLVSGK
jgi:uncharacterized membrane protein YeaQ/YmgE (transglycosylase-associated protein family)